MYSLWSRYEKWLAGEDLGHHPTDEQKTSAMTIAPAPSAEEFLINRTNNDREVRNVLLFRVMSHYWTHACTTLGLV